MSLQAVYPHHEDQVPGTPPEFGAERTCTRISVPEVVVAVQAIFPKIFVASLELYGEEIRYGEVVA